MKRIIYVPWPKSDCPVLATAVDGWAKSYGGRNQKVSRESKAESKDEKEGLKPAEVYATVQRIKASPQIFEVIFWDGPNKKKLQDLHKVEEGDLPQLYVVGHGDPDAGQIYPERHFSHNGLRPDPLVEKLLDEEALPENFNGKVKLFMCQSGVKGRRMEIGGQWGERNVDSFAQQFANEFLRRRRSAQVFGYTEKLAHSITGVLAFKCAVEGPDNDWRYRIGASNFRQPFRLDPEYLTYFQ
jgi:hypothetical protein